MQAEQVISGFEILAVVKLDELNATGIWARHQKSGAEVFHLLNDDSENLFALAFATTPEDSTGVTHIIEHSVLCGSEKYPLKDAFLILAQGSLNTYLNAWTFPDKTVYPASSINETDYFNLMSVYADAVFRPLLAEWTFMQEGRRFEFVKGEEGEKERLSITGVVYNEMKGAYSSFDTYANYWATSALLPDTPYSFEAGGDPDCIPDLTFEQFRAYHRKRYSPANCRIFLAGNIPTEKQLAFLDENCLAGLPRGEAAPPIACATQWDAPRVLWVPCPAGSEQGATVLVSWRCGDAPNSNETLALNTLMGLLLGHDGSPLNRALVESGIGEDLSPASGFEDELRETVLTMGLRGVSFGEKKGWEAAVAGKVEAVIFKELERLVKDGIPREEIDAALVSLEFSNREIKRASGPFSLVWLRRSLRGWLHGTKPWESLLFMPPFTNMKEQLAKDSRYFEKLIQTYLLDNQQRALIVVDPEAGFLEKKEAEQARQLAEMEASLSPDEVNSIKEKTAALASVQEAAEALAAIPHLSRADLSPDIPLIPRGIHDAGGIPVLTHDIFTNGITYIDLMIPIDTLEPEDYPILPLLSQAILALGLPGKDYAEVSGLLARTVGGLTPQFKNGALVSGASRAIATPAGVFDLGGRDWLIYRLKALDEKVADGLDLALNLITAANFSDHRRLKDVVLGYKNDADADFAPSGHLYAASRAGLSYSRSMVLGEILNGIFQIEYLHHIASLDTAQLSLTLSRVRDGLAAAGMFINISASADAVRAGLHIIDEKCRCFGPPKPRKARTETVEPFLALLGKTTETVALPEVFASPSLQVGFAGMCLPGIRYPSPEYTAGMVLSHHLSTGSLWENIRMKGGAYGVFANLDGLEKVFAFATYRDPDPFRSLSAFSSALREAAERGIDEESLEKAIIGVYAKDVSPQTPAHQGFANCLRFLYGIEEDTRQRVRRNLLDLSAGAFTEAARYLSAGAGTVCLITGAASVEKTAEALGTPFRTLPV
jgi:Zn-dependent M16 (insulinase) family peptidase